MTKIHPFQVDGKHQVGLHQVDGKPNKWSRVTGPAGACILTARRIGWLWPAFDVFTDRSGRQIHLRDICPQDVRALAQQDSDAAMWENGLGSHNGRAWRQGHASNHWSTCASRARCLGPRSGQLSTLSPWAQSRKRLCRRGATWTAVYARSAKLWARRITVFGYAQLIGLCG